MIPFDKEYPPSVLFVCTGNTCRSPTAEGIMKHLLPEEWRKLITVGSAGTCAGEGAPPSEMALAVSLERGINLSGHRSRLLTKEIVEHSSLILTMERNHLEIVKGAADKTSAFLVSDYPSMDGGGEEIEDPMGLGRGAYEELFEALEREISRIVGYLTDE